MNTLELSKALGQTGTFLADGMHFSVRITDAKQVYGNVRYLVTPVSGTGSAWVSASRVILDPPKAEQAQP